MKTRIYTLFLLFATVLIFMPCKLSASGSVDPSELARPTMTQPIAEQPSSRSFLRNEKNASKGLTVSPLMREHRGTASLFGRASKWDALVGEQDGGGHSVAGPIGDATLPIVLSLLILYLAYRGISTSRRKNEL